MTTTEINLSSLSDALTNNKHQQTRPTKKKPLPNYFINSISNLNLTRIKIKLIDGTEEEVDERMRQEV